MAQPEYVPVVSGVINENTPPLRSSQPAVDLAGFFDLVEKAMANYIKSEYKADQVIPLLVHEFPKERLAKPDTPFDIITYKIKQAEMSPTMKDGSKPRSPRQRQSVTHPTLGTNYQFVTNAWWEDVQAEFCIWSKSSRNSFLIGDWFHLFMMKFAFTYKLFFSRGIQNFKFVSRSDDEVDQSFGQELYKVRLTYAFRIEKFTFVEQRLLTDLDIYFGVSSASSHINLAPTDD